LPELKARIFDLILRAGVDGISGADLFDLAYCHREKRVAYKTLHIHIHQINELIEDEGYRIRGKDRYYRLDKI
jgi:hypothetical protein